KDPRPSLCRRAGCASLSRIFAPQTTTVGTTMRAIPMGTRMNSRFMASLSLSDRRDVHLGHVALVRLVVILAVVVVAQRQVEAIQNRAETRNICLEETARAELGAPCAD